jgi:threonine dehydrogenase-like Zn-dependent dehydrogenase
MVMCSSKFTLLDYAVRHLPLKYVVTDIAGSDLHFYRGTEGPATGFTLGHELLGEIVEVGKGIKRFKQGDLVIAPFSLSCGTSLSYHDESWMLMDSGECYYCEMGFTSRCDKSISLGCPGTEGAQAEYIRIPLADSSLFHVEKNSTIPQDLMLIMTDILPTGYSAAYNARKLLGEEWGIAGAEDSGKKGVCVVMGCGPVRLNGTLD